MYIGCRFRTVEHHSEGYEQLVDCLAEDVLGHCPGDQGSSSPVRLAFQELWSWQLG